MTKETYIKELNKILKRAHVEVAIEELEKIRQEICDIEEPSHDFEGFYYCLEEVLKIIDKYIKELKGECEEWAAQI